MDHAGSKSTRDASRMLKISRIDVTGESVDRIVSNANSFVFVAIRNHDEHRPENFFACDRHVVVHVGEDRRPHEVSASDAVGPAWSADDDLSTFLDSSLQQSLNLL